MGVLIVFALVAVVASTTGFQITVYRENKFEGVNYTLDVTNCVELTDNEIGSIHTHGNCVHLYKSRSCFTDLAQFLRVQPGIQSDRLDIYGYEDRIKSIGPCHRCFKGSSAPTIKLVPSCWKSFRWTENPYELQSNFSITACHNIPQGLTEWSSLSSSLITLWPRNVCIEVFHLPECSGHSARFLSTSGIGEMKFFLRLLGNTLPCIGGNDCMEGEGEGNCIICPRGKVKCPNTTRCVPFTSFCEDCADVPGICDTTKNFTTTPDAEMSVSGTQKISFIGKYRWQMIMNIDNSQNTKSVTRTSAATTTIVTNYKSLINSIENKNYGFSGGIEISAINIKGKLNYNTKQSYETSIETKTYNKVVRTITDEYNVGPYSNLTLYQLVFDGPGISEATETIATTPVVMEDVNIIFTIQKIKVLKGITVVYTDDAVSRPSNHIRDARGKKADINDGHGGEYVWLVPEFTQDYTQGVSGMEIALQYSKNTSLQDLTKSSRSRGYKYLLFLKDTTANVRVTEVVIFRTSKSENADPKTFGWSHCTSDIFEDDSIEYLYICWKTIHYEEPGSTSKNKLQVVGTYNWELMLKINNTNNNSTTIRRKITRTTATDCSYNRLMKSISESTIGGNVEIDLGGLFKIVNIGLGLTVNINAEARSSLESSVQNQTDINKVTSQEDEYVIGPNSYLILYRLILTAPGFNQATDMISSTPDRIDDIVIGLTLKQTLVLSGIDVVYTKHTVNRPKDHISDIRFLQPDINWGYDSGQLDNVFLVPKWTLKASEGVTGFEVVIQGTRNLNFKDLAPGSGDGLYRFLVPTKNPTLNTRITRVALYRKKLRESFSFPTGWDSCTSDINDGRDKFKYFKNALYLCWKSTPYQDIESDYNFGGYVSPLSSNSTSLIRRSGNIFRRIIGGEKAGRSEFPMQVSIQVKIGRKWFHFCGGVIVELNKVITAGHCCASEQMDGRAGPIQTVIRIVAGVIDIEKPVNSRQVRMIDRLDNTVYKKPQTPDQLPLNDVCKLYLTNNFDSTTYVQKTNLCRSEPRTGICTTSGWGLTENNDRAYPPILQKLDLPFVPRDICSSSKHYNYRLDSSIICAGGSEAGQGICSADSGGPLICNSCLAGITSWSRDPCGTLNYPDLFANVASFSDFIGRD